MSRRLDSADRLQSTCIDCHKFHEHQLVWEPRVGLANATPGPRWKKKSRTAIGVAGATFSVALLLAACGGVRRPRQRGQSAWARAPCTGFCQTDNPHAWRSSTQALHCAGLAGRTRAVPRPLRQSCCRPRPGNVLGRIRWHAPPKRIDVTSGAPPSPARTRNVNIVLRARWPPDALTAISFSSEAMLLFTHRGQINQEHFQPGRIQHARGALVGVQITIAVSTSRALQRRLRRSRAHRSPSSCGRSGGAAAVSELCGGGLGGV